MPWITTAPRNPPYVHDGIAEPALRTIRMWAGFRCGDTIHAAADPASIAHKRLSDRWNHAGLSEFAHRPRDPIALTV